MSHLMCQGEDGIQRSVKAHQHVRMHAVNAVRVGSAPLSLIFIDIDPAVPETIL